MNKTIWSGIGLVILVASFLIWLRSHDKGVRAEAKALAEQDSIKAVTEVLDAADDRRHTDSIAASIAIKAAYVNGAKLHTSANAALVTADSLHKLPATVANLQQENVALRNSMTSLRSELEQKDKVIIILQARYASSDSSAKAWKDVAYETRLQLAAANKRANSHWACVIGGGSTAGVGVIGSTTVSVGFGMTIGPSVTCGYKL